MGGDTSQTGGGTGKRVREGKKANESCVLLGTNGAQFLQETGWGPQATPKPQETARQLGTYRPLRPSPAEDGLQGQQLVGRCVLCTLLARYILQKEQKSAGRGSPDLQASSTEQVVEMEIKQTGHRLYLPQPCKNFLHPHSLLHVLDHLCTEETYHRSFRIPDLAPRISMVLFIY